MADEDKPPVLLATTPSLGVRLWIEPSRDKTHDMVCLQVGNEGGRGNPVRVVMLPVRLISPICVESVIPLDTLPGDCKGIDERPMCSLHFRKPPASLPTPFCRRYDGDEWRRMSRDEPWVLVLAIFANLEADQRNADQAAEVTKAVKAFFDKPQHPAAWLRRGLVHLAAADVPRPPTVASSPDVSGQETAVGKATLPTESGFSFALASCQYPAGLVDGTPQRWRPDGGAHEGPADSSMLRLADRLGRLALDDADRPSLLVLTGDQIYADATAGLFDPRAGGTPQARSSIRQAEDWLRIPYQNWLGSVGAQSVLGRLKSLMMLDDHEIDDNWEPPTLPARPGEAVRMELLMQAGSQAYQRYQRDLREGMLLDHLWHMRTHRQIRFFMADTRTERDARNAAMGPLLPCIMSGNQAAELYTWIEQDPAQPAFVVSPAMLLPRRRRSAANLRAALHADAWDGYPGSLYHLLARVWKSGRSNLVFLSGDEHLSGAVKATITRIDRPDRVVTLHSVHSSGLYSPYPFANAVPELFALPDDWTFEDPHEAKAEYRCVVEPCTPWVPGDGFTLLRLAPPADEDVSGAWQLDLSFDRADRQRPAPQPLVLAPGPGPLQPPPG